MNSLRKILYPLSLIYGEIVNLRNIAFEKGLIKSVQFELPVICVGNLNVGGTGKSPQIEYLIRLLQEDCNIGVLSRGYGRKTKGFQLADINSDADQIGDEPMQFWKNFPDTCIAVDEKRVRGIEQLQNAALNVDLILLDDAFQHRYVRAGYYILLTAFDNMYVDDLVLPAGDLRERRVGAKRADVILVTKCPQNLDSETKKLIVKRLDPKEHQKVFFTSIEYQPAIKNNSREIAINDVKKYKVLLVTGIANPGPLEEFLRDKNIEFEHLEFSDHHKFKASDLEKINNKFQSIKSVNKLILTTEKDYVRNFRDSVEPIYYLAIKTAFIDQRESFDNLINNYVRKNKRNH